MSLFFKRALTSSLEGMKYFMSVEIIDTVLIVCLCFLTALMVCASTCALIALYWVKL